MTRRAAWRSLLFTPADQPALVDKAIRCGPDAVILDLEDSVAEAAKDTARAHLAASARRLRDAGVDVVVRVNAEAPQADLDAAVIAPVSALMIPKAHAAADLNALSRRVGALEAARGLDAGAVGLIALIESPAAVLAMGEIAGAQRLVALAFGSEDFALGLGAPPTEASLDLPCKLMALHAAATGLAALGLPISIAAFREPDRYEAAARHGRAVGVTGALCIHPAQVGVVNRIFAPSPAELARAAALVAAWDAAALEGRAVFAFEGAMVDAPVVQAARALLARAPAADPG